MASEAPEFGDPETVIDGSTDSGGRLCAKAAEARRVAGNKVLVIIFLKKQSMASPSINDLSGDSSTGIRC
jgi:hypothetical protein